MSTLFPVTLSGAQTSRRGKVLVGPVNLTLEDASAVIVIGPNGSGKTTLLRLMHGAARLTKGTITWACDDRLARRKQAFVFQRPVMLRRSVLENLIYPMRLSGTPRANAIRAAQDWAVRVDLQDALDRPAPLLSGGEQQKLAIARALIMQPELLFLDEPTASLDGRSMREIEQILQEAQQTGTRLIMSTHDMGQARRLAQRAIFMLGGQVHETDSADAFFTQPRTPEAKAFLKGDIVE